MATKFQEATVFFKLGVKANRTGVHRTLNRPPKGKGWVPCRNMPEGMLFRHEAIGLPMTRLSMPAARKCAARDNP